MRGGEGIRPEPHHGTGRGWAQEAAAAHLTARLPEVLGQESVEDGVHAGVPVGQTVGHDAQDEGCWRQREAAELHPHGDDVVRCPTHGEDGNHQEDSLRCLQGTDKDRHINLYLDMDCLRLSDRQRQ